MNSTEATVLVVFSLLVLSWALPKATSLYRAQKRGGGGDGVGCCEIATHHPTRITIDIIYDIETVFSDPLAISPSE